MKQQTINVGKSKTEATVQWSNGITSSYLLAGDEPYRRKDGKWINLRVWETSCVICNVSFVVKTSGSVSIEETVFSRRCCDEHKHSSFCKKVSK
jgi:hypothetical protein